MKKLSIQVLEASRRFILADEESLANARLALNPDRPSAFFLTGPVACGKSTFAADCLRRVFGWRRLFEASPWPIPKHHLEHAAEQGWLLVDGVYRHSPALPLVRFLTCPSWAVTRQGAPRREVAINTLTFLIGDEKVLSPDLRRRVRIIRFLPLQTIGEAIGTTVSKQIARAQRPGGVLARR